MKPGKVSGEPRLLVDPCRDQPERHFAYTVRGEILRAKRFSEG